MTRTISIWYFDKFEIVCHPMKSNIQYEELLAEIHYAVRKIHYVDATNTTVIAACVAAAGQLALARAIEGISQISIGQSKP